MDPFEDRIRASLSERADDVEPTPALYREVQRRVDRRRRRALVWAPVGAAVAAAVAIPLVLTSGPQVPTIDDVADQPGGAATGATEVVEVDAAGTTWLRDLGTGERRELSTGDDAPLAPRVLVGVDRRDETPRAVVVQTVDRAEVAGGAGADVTPGTRPADEVPGTAPADVAPAGPTLRATAHVAGQRLLLPTDPAPGFAVAAAGGAALAPDGGWLATLVAGDGGGDADGWAVQLTEVPASPDVTTLETLELTLVLPAGSRLESWTTTDADAGRSRLAARGPDGRVLHLPMVTGADGVPVWEDEQVDVAVDRPVDAYADDHVGGRLLLADGTLTYLAPAATDGEDVRTTRDLSALVGDDTDVVLRAFGTTTLVTTTEGSWVVSRGPDGFGEPRRLDDAADVAPVGRDLAAEAPAPDTGPDVGTDPGTPDVDEGASSPGAGLPLVLSTGDALVLRTEDGATRDLARLAPEGESTIEDLAVRPGSTLDDLTVAYSTTAEGFTDVRWVRLRATDDEPRTGVLDASPYAPASATDADVILGGLAWLPDGTRLQWLERDRASGEHALTSIAWSGDGPGGPDERTDDARFGLPALEGTAARLVDAVALDPSTTQLRFLDPSGDTRWWAWDLVVQADGSPSVTGEPEVVPAPSDGMLLAVAGRDDERRPTAWLLDRDGAIVLRHDDRDTVVGERAPDLAEPTVLTQLHEVPGGHLVRTDDRVVLVTGDGEVVELAPALGAAPVR